VPADAQRGWPQQSLQENFLDTTPNPRELRSSEPIVRLSTLDVPASMGHVALQYLPIGSPHLHADPLYGEPRVLLMSDHHRFCGAPGVTSADYLASPTVQPLSYTPAHWSNFWSFAELREGAPLDYRREFDNVHAAIMFISVTDDVSIPVPASISRFVAFGGVRYVPVTDAPACTAAVVSRVTDRRPVVRAFRRIAVDTAHRLRFLVAQATAPGAGRADA
jgi:LysR substrate binding domain